MYWWSSVVHQSCYNCLNRGLSNHPASKRVVQDDRAVSNRRHQDWDSPATVGLLTAACSVDQECWVTSCSFLLFLFLFRKAVASSCFTPFLLLPSLQSTLFLLLPWWWFRSPGGAGWCRTCPGRTSYETMPALRRREDSPCSIDHVTGDALVRVLYLISKKNEFLPPFLLSSNQWRPTERGEREGGGRNTRRQRRRRRRQRRRRRRRRRQRLQGGEGKDYPHQLLFCPNFLVYEYFLFTFHPLS